MREWIAHYLKQMQILIDLVPIDQICSWIGILKEAVENDRQIFIFGNGGSAANAMHFSVDLGKGASDKVGKRFRVICLNDNISWLTAIANDYEYADVFVRQLENFAHPKDIALALSVSGSSLNCVRAIQWAKKHQMQTFALVGRKDSMLAQLADHVICIGDTHYGRVEDLHMIVLHILCYSFMEGAA